MNDVEVQLLIGAYNTARFQLSLAAEKLAELPNDNAVVRAYIVAHAKFDLATMELQDARVDRD
jgi:hypothetical protein